jgi:uncharacterized protein YchJ
MNYEVKYFPYFSFGVTDDIDMRREVNSVTDEIADKLESILKKLSSNQSKGLEKQIKKLIVKYPKTPLFHDALITYYAQTNRIADCKKEAKSLCIKFPDFLNSKLVLADLATEEKDFDKVCELLGKDTSLEKLFPQRKIFLTNEVISFYETVFYYYHALNDFEKLEYIADLMIEIDKNSPQTLGVTKTMVFLEMLQREKEQEDLPQIEHKSYNNEIQTDEKPEFNHPKLIEKLYEHDVNIPEAILKDILMLPRDSVIQDLETVLMDSIKRYEYLDENYMEDYEITFPIHALYLLAELKSEKSLDTVLEFMRQGDELMEFYLGDYVEECLWEIVFTLGCNHTIKLKNFLLESSIWELSKYYVAKAIIQLYLHGKLSKEKATSTFKDYFIYQLNAKRNDNIIDSGLNGLMINAISKTDLFENLIPDIEELFANKRIDKQVCGNMKDIIQDHQKISSYTSYKEDVLNINNRYAEFIKTLKEIEEYHYNPDNEEPEYYSPNYKDYNDYEEKSNNEHYIEDNDNLIHGTYTTQKSVGRNDSCPCGSGKKYKKCCLK